MDKLLDSLLTGALLTLLITVVTAFMFVIGAFFIWLLGNLIGFIVGVVVIVFLLFTAAAYFV